MTVFPDLSRYDRFSLDTEGTGLHHGAIPVGASISTPDGQDHYLRWGHQEGGNNCSLVQFLAWAKRELTRPGQVCVVFNALYDLRVLRAVGCKVGAVVEDVSTICALLNEYELDSSLEGLSQKYLGRGKDETGLIEYCTRRFGGRPTRKAQAPNYWKASGEQVADYAKQDSRLTLDLYDLKHPELLAAGLGRIYQTETMLLPVLLKMYFAGVRVDVPEANRVVKVLTTEYAQLAKEWDAISGGFRFSERNKMVELFDRLEIQYPRNPPTERMKAKGIKVGHPRLDKTFLDSLEHPVGKLIRQMRQVVHYRDTFIQSYLLDNLQAGDLIYPQFHPTRSERGGTITGRFSSSGGLNAQNIPARDERWAPLIRGMFIPLDDDHLWLKADMSQIEYRFFAHYAGGNLRRAYLQDPDTDFHQFVMDLTNLKRKQAKNTNFAKLYGAGIARFALTAGITEEEAEEIMGIYDRKIPEAKRLYNKVMNRAASRGFITSWGGRILRFQAVGERRKKYLNTHNGLNKLLQGSAADQIKASMIQVDQVIDWQDEVMHLTVHDELDFSIPKGDRGVRTARRIKEAMEDHEVTVPLRAEVEVGQNWGHTDPLFKKPQERAA